MGEHKLHFKVTDFQKKIFFDIFLKNKMKLTASFLVALASGDVCGDCNENIAEFNAWHAQSNIICSRYTHPRDYAEFADPRAAACKTARCSACPTTTLALALISSRP